MKANTPIMQGTSPTSETSLLLAGIGGSLTWVSDDTKERDNFRKMRSNVGFVAPNSPFIPADINDWLIHRVATLVDTVREIERSVALKRMKKASVCNEVILPALGGTQFGDFRSTVLARKTIWRPDEIENPSRPQAPWPDSSERKHEGYQRVRSGYSRFPPLPRVPGNPTVNWKQRSPINAYDFDQVGQPVVMQESTTENDRCMELFLGMSLLQEINT